MTSLAERPSPEPPPPAEPTVTSPAYANYVLGVLFVAYVFNFMDRQSQLPWPRQSPSALLQ